MSTNQYDLRSLRPALVILSQGARAPGSAGEDDEDDGEPGVGAGAPTPPSPADADDEAIRDPTAHRLSQEAASYRRQLREAQGQLATLQTDLAAARADLAATAGLQDQLATAQRQNAFLMAAVGQVTDLEAAWKLIADDTDRSPADLVAHVLDRYPYLSAEDADPGFRHDDDGFLPNPHRQPSGRPANGRGSGLKPGDDRKTLEKKFPALKGRG